MILLCSVIVSIIGWSFQKTCAQVDDHERRIRASEQTLVQLDFIARDVAEIKTDLKKFMRGDR